MPACLDVFDKRSGSVATTPGIYCCVSISFEFAGTDCDMPVVVLFSSPVSDAARPRHAELFSGSRADHPGHVPLQLGNPLG